MRKIIIAAVAIATPLLATATFAIPYFPPANNAYVSADIGFGNLATPSQYLVDPNDAPEVLSSASYQTGNLAGGASVGYQHALSPRFLIGAELGYDYNGNAKYTEGYQSYLGWDDTTMKISSQDFHALATGTVMLKYGFNVFAKAGVARVNEKLDVSNVPSELSDTVYEDHLTGYKPMAAAGLGYQIHAVELYAEYSHIFGSDDSNFDDLISSDGHLKNIVSVDTIKAGIAAHIRI